MTDNPSAVPIQRPQYNFAQTAQGLGGLTGLNHELGSNEHVSGISSASPYHTTSVNHANTFPPARHSSAMPMGYDVPPHLVTGPRGYQGIESQRQLDGHPTPGMTPCIPFAHGPPRLEYYDAPAITENNGGAPSHVPLSYNVAGPFRGTPSVVYSGVPVIEDLKGLASRYLHNPGSNVDKLRIRRSRSGTVKVFIFLDIPVASGALRLEQFAPTILEVPNDGPPGHVPPLNVPGSSRGNPSFGHPVNYGMSVADDIEDLASRYLYNSGSHVDKLRVRRSRSGTVKVLILLEIDDTM